MMNNIAKIIKDFTSIADILIDPESAIRRLDKTRAWLWPLMLVSFSSAVVSLASLPILLRVIKQNMPPGLDEVQIQEMMTTITKYQYVSVIIGPFVLLLKILLSSLILLMACNLLNLSVSYRKLFALAAQCSMTTLVQVLCFYLVLRSRGADVQPADFAFSFGLDIFAKGLPAPLMALASYISIFNLWYVIILSLGLYYLSGCTMKKAWLAATPVWLVPMILSIMFVSTVAGYITQ